MTIPGEPKHSEALRLIKIAMGQLKKVQDMIENNEYCPNISIQLLAVISILKKVNTKVLSKHLETCMREATEMCEVEDKIEELEKIFELLERTY